MREKPHTSAKVPSVGGLNWENEYEYEYEYKIMQTQLVEKSSCETLTKILLES
jgi:hypothetical protein